MDLIRKMGQSVVPRHRLSYGGRLKRDMKRNYELYLISIPVLLYYIIFCYVPMYGVQIAFKDYSASKGFLGSEWVGFEHFIRFFKSYNFSQIMVNTLVLSLYSMAASFPIPIVFAILINEVRGKKLKKSVQMISYAPYFISTVVLVGMMISFCSPTNGIINKMLGVFSVKPIAFFAEPEWFKHIYVWSGVWQTVGWNSIIYISTLSGVDVQLYEAAVVDGANKLQRIWHVDVPALMPTVVLLMILNVGGLLNLGFEKVFAMQNSLNLSSSEVIATYVYKVGILGTEYSFSAAVGLFNSVINCVLLVLCNTIAKRVSDMSLW